MKVKIVLEFDTDGLDREYGALLGEKGNKFCSEASPEELRTFVEESLFDEGNCIQDYVKLVTVESAS